MAGVELLKREKVEFNILCVLSQANVERPKELYRFYRSIGIDNIQFIPLAEFDGGRQSPALHHHAGTVRTVSVRDVRAMVAGAAQGADPLFRQHRRGPGRPEARQLHHARNLRQLRGGGVQRRRLPLRFFRGGRMEAGQRQPRFLAGDCAAHASLQLRPARRRWRIRSARCANTSRSATAAAPSSATGRTGASRIWIISATRTR